MKIRKEKVCEGNCNNIAGKEILLMPNTKLFTSTIGNNRGVTLYKNPNEYTELMKYARLPRDSKKVVISKGVSKIVIPFKCSITVLGSGSVYSITSLSTSLTKESIGLWAGEISSTTSNYYNPGTVFIYSMLNKCTLLISPVNDNPNIYNIYSEGANSFSEVGLITGDLIFEFFGYKRILTIPNSDYFFISENEQLFTPIAVTAKGGISLLTWSKLSEYIKAARLGNRLGTAKIFRCGIYKGDYSLMQGAAYSNFADEELSEELSEEYEYWLQSRPSTMSMDPINNNTGYKEIQIE